MAVGGAVGGDVSAGSVAGGGVSAGGVLAGGGGDEVAGGAGTAAGVGVAWGVFTVQATRHASGRKFRGDTEQRLYHATTGARGRAYVPATDRSRPTLEAAMDRR